MHLVMHKANIGWVGWRGVGEEEKKKCRGYVLPEGRILNKTHPDSCPAGQSGLNWPTESL